MRPAFGEEASSVRLPITVMWTRYASVYALTLARRMTRPHNHWAGRVLVIDIGRLMVLVLVP